ncbi:hypothetical protein D9757_004447 [Collybiopsis confluens]|uniref:Haloacid dehalogenase n=1 Tax=Collybiopsis confluens TaxID=2823264 RepID=A0A8H5HWR4_9AGAR|nr:hypothetical protein D9757_004447 [Collybiopsis confluens]
MSDAPARITDFKVLVFDVYGTLADWETGIYEELKPMLSRYRQSAGWSRKEVLEAFTAVEADLQAKFPSLLYSDLLAKAHEVMEQTLRASAGEALEGAGLDSSGASTSDQSAPVPLGEAHIRFGQSIKNWSIFPDSSAALHALSKHYKLVVLSNVDRQSFSHTLAKLSEGGSTAFAPESYSPPESEEYWFPQRNPGSKSPFTLVLTAQDVQSYKPALHGFKVALDVIHKDAALLNTPKDRVLWVAQSLSHDIEPANRLGVTGVYINRRGAYMGFPSGAEPHYAWKFETLGEMAEAVEKA